MNKILLLLAMMLPIATHAETADGDTVVIKKPREVTVITNDSLQQIVVKGRYGDEGYVYKNINSILVPFPMLSMDATFILGIKPRSSWSTVVVLT